MQLHIVGGFLGSGKTTAIAGAAKHLLSAGQWVGVITNDQGRYLVDTAFFRLGAVPAMEVTGGCFCCNYDDLDARLDQLIAEQQPDVVFAEAVGSCADLVATVLKPLLSLRQSPASLSVFTDARLLRRYLHDEPLPFSDDVLYIFGQQIEEASLLVINKIDLLPDAAAVDEVQALTAARWPGLALHAQSALDPAGIAGWVAALAPDAVHKPAHKPAREPASLAIDYARYAAGEAALAWFNQSVTLLPPAASGASDPRDAVQRTLDHLAAGIRGAGWAVGHVKIAITDGAGTGLKLSLTALPEPDAAPSQAWSAPRETWPTLASGPVTLLINARAETSPDALAALVAESVAAAGVPAQVGEVESFRPAPPTPTHRMA